MTVGRDVAGLVRRRCLRCRVPHALAFAGFLLLAAGCATPSGAEIAEHDAEIRRLNTARAVHMPKGIESCVGVTLRLADPTASGDAIAERERLARKLTTEEVNVAIKAAGMDACREIYLDAVARGSASPEPMDLVMSYGIDPGGHACAVVEMERMEPIDPGANPVLEQSASCLKEVLFRAQFPVGRVEDKERVVLTVHLVAQPPAKDRP